MKTNYRIKELVCKNQKWFIPQKRFWFFFWVDMGTRIFLSYNDAKNVIDVWNSLCEEKIDAPLEVKYHNV